MSNELRYWIFHNTAGKLVFSLVCIVALWILLRFIKLVISKNVKDNDHRYRSKKLLDFFGFVITITIIIIVFSAKMNNVTVALGIAGAGIAFALQEIISSVAGWLAVMLGGFYKTGDRVQLGGIKGDVIDIGVIRTTLMEMGEWVDGDLYNGRIVRVANSFVFKEPVYNYSGDFEYLWDEIKIPIQYGSNYEKTREIFSNIANDICGESAKAAEHMWQQLVKKYLIEDATTESKVTLVANSNCVEFTIRYIVAYQKRRMTKDKLYTRILNEVDVTNGEIRFATSLVQLINTADKRTSNT